LYKSQTWKILLREKYYDCQKRIHRIIDIDLLQISGVLKNLIIQIAVVRELLESASRQNDDVAQHSDRGYNDRTWYNDDQQRFAYTDNIYHSFHKNPEDSVSASIYNDSQQSQGYNARTESVSESYLSHCSDQRWARFGP